MTGKLYVIGTPIGNLKDITLRAVETFGKVELLVCEDSRVASRLVNYYRKAGLISETPQYFAYNDFNEGKVYERVLENLREGMVVGLISDAGMPTLSDPGYRLISAALSEGVEVEIVPGPTALTTALAWSGIGGEAVLYLGFLPKKEGKSRQVLEEAAEILVKFRSLRVVLYVSPHRLVKELRMIKEILGEVRCVLLREMTKVYQERVEGSTSELIAKYEEAKPKGELVLVLGEGGGK